MKFENFLETLKEDAYKNRWLKPNFYPIQDDVVLKGDYQQ